MTPADDQGAHPLASLGFDRARVAETVAAGSAPGLVARVVWIDRGWATLQGTRRVRRVALRDCPQIVVGDWLAPDGQGVLQRLERRSLLVRRSVSGRDEPQLMAANVDVVLVTWALDTRVGSSRLMDMLALARDSGAVPVLVLSKVDTADSGEGLLAELGDELGQVEVVTTSTVTGEGLDRLRELTTGRTVVLLGASGAGKSTLTNVLLGADAQETGEVGRTGEGRHTTTRRELLPLPGGGAIIDTPGIRAAVHLGRPRRGGGPLALPRPGRAGRGVPVFGLHPRRHAGLRPRPGGGRRHPRAGPAARRPGLPHRAHRPGRGPGRHRPAGPPGPQPAPPALNPAAAPVGGRRCLRAPTARG